MATKTTTKPATKQPKKTERPANMPEGFEPLAFGGKVKGWFVREPENTIQGFVKGSVEFKGKYGMKRLYRIELTMSGTKAMNADGEFTAKEGDLIGLDESGWLKKLADVEPDREVWIECVGKDEPTKDMPQGQWKFNIGVVPV